MKRRRKLPKQKTHRDCLPTENMRRPPQEQPQGFEKDDPFSTSLPGDFFKTVPPEETRGGAEQPHYGTVDLLEKPEKENDKDEQHDRDSDRREHGKQRTCEGDEVFK